MNTLSTIKEKQRFVSKRYLSAVLSAGCLSLCANRSFGALIGSNLLVLVIALASGSMASSISFQFYQFPAAFSSKFGDDNAICLSMLEAMGYGFGSAVFKLVGLTTSVSQHGWSLAWLELATFFCLGGYIITNLLPSIIETGTENDVKS